ncbi:MAG: hypothetical protein IT310_01485 [Anaerolineales bacterium]|nr:hypothetical protein [Anaerolineales bacterium]
MKLKFGYILARAGEIIWKYKILWVFGIFAGFAENRSGGNSNSLNNSNSNNGAPLDERQIVAATERFKEFLQEYLLIVIFAALVLILLGLAFYALGMMGRIGLIKGVVKAQNGAERLAFAEIWAESFPFFWRFFGLNLLLGLAFLILFLPFVAIAFLSFGVPFLACLFPLFCLLIPVSWAVGLVLEQAQVAIVQEDLSMMDGVKRGYEIVKSDIGGMIVMSLILGVGSFIIGLVLMIPMILALIPLFTSLIFEQGSFTAPGVIVSLTCCGLYYPVLLLISGILTSYVKAVWTLSYLQLATPNDPNAPINASAFNA